MTFNETWRSRDRSRTKNCLTLDWRENPKYPDLLPAQELVIQGVMVALIRKRK